MSLPTLLKTVQKLQKALQAKAKAEPNYRFYSLWDKVYRRDVLWQAYRHCRANNGAPGVDRVTFDQIEIAGVGPWLAKLQEELRNKSYHSQPLLRIWISKSNGGQRPLGIPAIRDRVAQMADATRKTVWHRVQAISFGLSLSNVRVVSYTYPSIRHAECEGLRF